MSEGSGLRVEIASWREPAFFLEALLRSVAARLLLTFVGFGRIQPFLGRSNLHPLADAPPEWEWTAAAVGRAVEMAARWTGSRHCPFTQSLAAHGMLRRQGLESVLCLGTSPRDDRAAYGAPHAWVRCGGIFVAGDADFETHAIVGRYVAPATASATSSLPAVSAAPPGDDEVWLEDLLVAMVRLPSRARRDEDVKRLDEAQWRRLTELAARLGVGGLLYSRLRGRGLAGVPPSGELDVLRREFLTTAARNHRAFREHDAVVSALGARGIRAVSLKGALLARQDYANPGERSMEDLDLLVRREDFVLSTAVLGNLGYVSERDCAAEDYLHKVKESPFHVRIGASTPMHMKWLLAHNPEIRRIDLDEIWQRVVPAGLEGVEAFALDPEDTILYLCDHLANQHKLDLPLRAICDLDILLERTGPSLDWDAVVERALRWRCSRAVFVSLRLARDWLGTTVPPDAIERLAPDRVDPEVEAALRRRAFRILDWKADARVTMPLTRAWDERHPGAKLRIVLARLFPDRLDMAMTYGIDSRSRIVYLYWASRPFQLLARYLRVAWMLFRGRGEETEIARDKLVLARWLAAG